METLFRIARSIFLTALLAVGAVAIDAAHIAGAAPPQIATEAPAFQLVRQTIDPCHKRCAPLLQQDSKSESKRTYGNCRALCDTQAKPTCAQGCAKRFFQPAALKWCLRQCK